MVHHGSEIHQEPIKTHKQQLHQLCVCVRVCVPAGGQVVQTGSDVMSVVVHLFTVEATLCLQAAESLTELLKLRPPTLTVQALLTDVLGGGCIFISLKYKVLKYSDL